MKTKISLNILDIDALTSVLEIARTASYAVEMNRLVKLAVLSSSTDELQCEYYKRMVVSAYRGPADDSPVSDTHSLMGDWAAVGADMHKAFSGVDLPSDLNDPSLEKKWKTIMKSRMRDVDRAEKSAFSG